MPVLTSPIPLERTATQFRLLQLVIDSVNATVSITYELQNTANETIRTVTVQGTIADLGLTGTQLNGIRTSATNFLKLKGEVN